MINGITLEDIKKHVRVDGPEDDTYIQTIIMPASSVFIRSYTGLTSEQMNTKEDLAIAYMVLCADMYNNRDYQIKNDKVNVVVKSILDMHSVNLL